MSRITGGIFSRPRGKTGGIVFGAARSRIGKVVTTRELVPPANPNTVAQQAQRSKFKECLNIVRRIGPDYYKTDFNRAVGQLAGFNSLQSLFLNQMDSSLVLTLTTPVNLGTLHYPDTCTVETGPFGGSITITPSTELGDNGTDADIATFMFVKKTATDRDLPNSVKVYTQARSQGATSVSDFESGEVYEVYIYFKGQGNAEGLYSVCNPYEVTAN